MARKVDDVEKAGRAQVQGFAAGQAKENALGAAARIPHGRRRFVIVIHFVILAVVIVPEREQVVGRFD
jgi:hypothetical protein